MIIDVHGHYTTAPKALEDWRNRQIAGIKDPVGHAQGVSELKISDDELREIDRRQPAQEDAGARQRPHHLHARAPASWRTTSATSRCRRPGPRSATSCAGASRSCFPTASSARRCCRSRRASIPKTCIPELEKCVKEYGFVGINLNPDPSGGHWTSPPLSDRHWYPIYEKMVELDIPAMIHVSTSCNACFHTTGAHYLNADTTAFMQCLTSDLFKDFPTLRFLIPHGGGAVPYHWGRFRGLAQELKKPLLKDHLLKNIFFDTCVYHQPGIDLLTKVIPVDNILFASEMIGAVRGIDPETGFYYDDTKRYIEASTTLSAEDRHKVYEGNARRVFPRLDAALKAKGK